MSKLASAYELDEQNRPLEALVAYEGLLHGQSPERRAFLNLAVLYLMCADNGFVVAQGIPPGVVAQSYSNAMRVLNLAELAFPGDPEILAWKQYLPFVVLGEDIDIEAFRRFALAGGGPLPLVILLSAPGGSGYMGAAEAELSLLKMSNTSRERYLTSVLRSALKQAGWRKGVIG